MPELRCQPMPVLLILLLMLGAGCSLAITRGGKCARRLPITLSLPEVPAAARRSLSLLDGSEAAHSSPKWLAHFDRQPGSKSDIISLSSATKNRRTSHRRGIRELH